METIECKHFVRWNLELDGTEFYVLIRIDYSDGYIHVGIADEMAKKPFIEFYGDKAQDIYHAIFEYEQKHGKQWFNSKTHMAYLGKELKKAEMALAIGSTYYQE